MPLDDLVQSLPTSKKLAGKSGKKDKIVVNPKLNDSNINEEKESTAVMAFGRFNPPTVGHEKLIHKVHEVAKEHDGVAHVVASHSEGTSKDPLPQSKKLHYLKKVAPSGVHVSGSSKESPSFLTAAKKLHDAGHKHLVMVAGSDRVDDYKKKLEQYNGKEGHYNFKSIKVVSSGERDPDAEGVAGMSGTKMRAHARAGEMEHFKAGLPKALHPHAKEIADHIRSVKEEVEELDEKVVDIRQRRLRSMTMKRIQSRLQRARALARERMAGQTQLKRRAFKQAKSILRKRYAGERSASYQDMSPSDRVILDKQVDPKVKLIKALVKRIIPRIKQAEVGRLAAVRKGTRPKSQKLPLTLSNDPLDYNTFNKLYEIAERYSHTDKEFNSLFKKSIQSGIPLGVISEVYKRGIQEWTEGGKTPQQLAFDRVNSFISGGKAFELDSDLSEGLKNPKDNPCWKGYKPVGTKKKGGKEVPNCVPEETQIDEISKDTLSSYASKAGNKLGGHISALPYTKDLAKHSAGTMTPDSLKKNLLRHIKNRTTGLARAAQRLAKEETQIDEISKDIKMRYVAKAAASTNKPKENETQSDYLERLHKRMSGIKKALASTSPAQRFTKEEHGAGDEGTDKLVKKYKKDTPCQENFMDGKNPEDKGDMVRHGLKGKSVSQLKKVRSSSSASPRAKQLAHWYINMQKGKNEIL